MSHEDMRVVLLTEHSVRVSIRTLRRFLAAASLRTYQTFRYAASPTETNQLLCDRITSIFHHQRVPDKQMLNILQAEGLGIGQKKLGKIRRSMGLHKQLPAADIAVKEQEYTEALSYELGRGSIEDFGRGMLYTFMRSKYTIIGQ